MASKYLITGPTSEPLTEDNVKKHRKIDGNDEDYRVLELIKAARLVTENETGRQLVTATYDYYIDEFADEIQLPYPPLQSVTTVKYYDVDGVQQTAAASLYEVVTTKEPGLIRLKVWDSQSWPSIQSSRPEPIVIRFVAGYGAASAVPETLKEAMRLLIGHWYENREDIYTGPFSKPIPRGFKSLINGMKMVKLA